MDLLVMGLRFYVNLCIVIKSNFNNEFINNEYTVFYLDGVQVCN